MTDQAAVSAPPPAESARRLAARRAFFRFRQSGLSLLGAAIVGLVMFVAVFGPRLAPFPEHVAGRVDTAMRFQPPSLAFPFGTNELGQDVLSLVLAGAQVSILAGLAVVVIGTVVGWLERVRESLARRKS